MTSNHSADINCSGTTGVKSVGRSVVAEVVAIKKPIVRMMETDVEHF